MQTEYMSSGNVTFLLNLRNVWQIRPEQDLYDGTSNSPIFCIRCAFWEHWKTRGLKLHSYVNDRKRP